MFQVNENYLKLPGSYLFSTVGKKVKAYSEAHPDKKVIRLGIGDVTQPLVPAIIKASMKLWMRWAMRILFTAMPRIWDMDF